MHVLLPSPSTEQQPCASWVTICSKMRTGAGSHGTLPWRMQNQKKYGSPSLAGSKFEKDRYKAIRVQQRYFWSLFLLQWGDLGKEGLCWHLTDKSQGYSCQPLGYSGGGLQY